MQVSLVARIDAILPQTQCTHCGYPDCHGYAEALADGRADIDQCPPGGDAGLVMLAQLLQRPIKPINPANGQHKPRVLALIDELHCIGCTLCIQACPVDAIVGAVKQMHTVIEAECTGCELCLPACPVDCIDLKPAVVVPTQSVQQQAEASRWRRRHQFHLFRVDRDKRERAERLAAKALAKKNDPQLAVKESYAKLDTALAPQAIIPSETVPAVDAKAVRIAEMMARAKRLREGPAP
ncbi:RnfABCDGE type electron transport complex subunit B [Chitinimonas sp. BJB300]|uniref:RnfABCDGE type electron transport complex subunit B n=1 Tax=Chitinimonas sp. BJB300 TaxID=1559339 RepID=UPI000C0C872B|nr:RnfABCDGE type electron transport complex subunit B [Chitinimonas sp. BJB300]PHV12178.1 hypothetical protein CSQ89_06925 [Chitinimonas sp. BJB300]TSJ91583.1 RnfABCDGE type electron transport complex subunit B [Chitinimonas sp. BJB300]